MQLQDTEVLYDEAEIVRAIEQFQAGTKKFWGACVDSTLPSFSVGVVKNGYLEANRSVCGILY